MSTNVDRINITVLGAGVIGLTSAMLLSRNTRYDVTVIAKHMPGDYDIEYCSPWAGANYLPNKDGEGPVGEWTKELVRKDPWYANVVPDGCQFRELERHELPSHHESGMGFTSVCINTAVYLPWLLGQCLKNGVKVQRGVVTDVSDAIRFHRSWNLQGKEKSMNVVINCTGLGAATLGGVMDKALYPARGQVVVVRNDPKTMVCTSGTDDGDEESTYIMHRAAGGGCILGGSLQPNNWSSEPDSDLALRIMQRSVAVCPALTDGKGIEALSVVRHGVGLRPMRHGGPRIEREMINGVWTVHCYGHGGYGYQSSYGSGYLVCEIVQDIGRSGSSERATL